MSKVAEQALSLDIPVQYSNVSIGEGTARVGVSIDRSRLNVRDADKKLCGRRLTGTLIAGGANDAPGQQRIPGTNTELTGVFDCKSIGMNRKKITAGLTFSLDGIELADLAGLAKRAGRLEIQQIEELPADAAEEPEEE